MSIVWPRPRTGFTRYVVALALLLFAVQLFASQPMAMGEERQGAGPACAFTEVLTADGHDNGQSTQHCNMSGDSDICPVNCSFPYAGKPAVVDIQSLASATYTAGYLFHTGRLISGPEPFPPK